MTGHITRGTGRELKREGDAPSCGPLRVLHRQVHLEDIWVGVSPTGMSGGGGGGPSGMDTDVFFSDY